MRTTKEEILKTMEVQQKELAEYRMLGSPEGIKKRIEKGDEAITTLSYIRRIMTMPAMPDLVVSTKGT